MTTPPVPQWAVDAAKRIWGDPGGSSSLTEMAKLIAARAPQETQDGARLDWLEKACAFKAATVPRIICREDGTTIWDVANGLSKMGDGTNLRAAIDAARKKDL